MTGLIELPPVDPEIITSENVSRVCNIIVEHFPEKFNLDPNFKYKILKFVIEDDLVFVYIYRGSINVKEPVMARQVYFPVKWLEYPDGQIQYLCSALDERFLNSLGDLVYVNPPESSNECYDEEDAKFEELTKLYKKVIDLKTKRSIIDEKINDLLNYIGELQKK